MRNDTCDGWSLRPGIRRTLSAGVRGQARRSLVWTCVLVGAVGLSGCSSGRHPTYPVQGQVVFEDGSPAKMGTVEFKSRNFGIQARGKIDASGQFTLTTYEAGDGAVAGWHDAVVVQFVPTERLKNFRGSPLGVIDARYASYATSQLSCEVRAEESNSVTLRVTGIISAPQQDRLERHHDTGDHHVRERANQ